MLRPYLNRTLVTATLLAFAMGVGYSVSSTAADSGEKARACHDLADKKGLTGDALKTFMENCMNKTAAPGTRQPGANTGTNTPSK